MKKIFIQSKIHSSFFIYILIGLITNLISFSLFIIQFEYIKVSFSSAQLVSSSIATTINYILNSKYTFKANHLFDFIKIIKYLFGLFITLIIVRFIFMFLYYEISLSSFYSYFISLIITSLFFFLWQKLFVFKKNINY